MSARILRLIVISVAAMMVGACGGSASASSPASPSAPIGGPVRTESDAVARVIASEPRFSGITARDPGLIGQAAWYEVTSASGVGAFLVTVLEHYLSESRGWVPVIEGGVFVVCVLTFRQGIMGTLSAALKRPL